MNYVFCATGKIYQQKVIDAAASIKKIDKKESFITVFTDKEFSDENIDEIIILDEPKFNYFDKISTLKKCNYKKYLFLDCDIRLIAPLDNLLKILDNFDIAVAHASWRNSLCLDKKNEYFVSGVPKVFEEYNTGVILLKTNNKSKELISSWEQIYKEQLQSSIKPNHDQPAFRKALWDNKQIRFHTLSPEYNLRCDFPCYVGSEVKILHSNSLSNMNFCEKNINRIRGARVFVPNEQKIFSFLNS